MRSPSLVVLVLSLTACSQRSGAVDAGPAASASAAGGAAPAPGKACHAEPPGGVLVPTAAKSQDVRLAAAGGRALITWLEPASSSDDSPGARKAKGRVFDGTKLEAELTLDSSSFGDTILSGVSPLSAGDTLETVGCTNSAPTGILYCYRQPPAVTKKKDFAEIDFGNGGPQAAGIAALAKANDTLVFVPVGSKNDVAVISSRQPAKRKRDFGLASESGSTAEALAAAFLDDSMEEALVAFRSGGVIKARTATWAETWKGGVVVVSEKGQEVGAPAIERHAGHTYIVYAARKDKKDAWRIVRATLSGAAVERAALDLPEATGITFGATRGACIHASWVEGRGKASVTKVGSFCGDSAKPELVSDLSQPGIEAGRAWLAPSGANEMVAWQQFPPGKAAELRTARLVCE